jgi:hypothetical protein
MSAAKLAKLATQGPKIFIWMMLNRLAHNSTPPQQTQVFHICPPHIFVCCGNARSFLASWGSVPGMLVMESHDACIFVVMRTSAVNHADHL